MILTGLTTNACILIWAGEVFVRGYQVIVPSDCVGALSPDSQAKALNLMEDNFGAQTIPSEKLDLDSFLIDSPSGAGV